jgi:hypothetical protein
MVFARGRVVVGLRWALALALVGCGARSTTGAKWPELHARDNDGGESLAPHQATETAAAAIEADPHPAAPPPTEVSIAPVVTPVTPPASSTSSTPEEPQPVQLEDTVIEIHDDE